MPPVIPPCVTNLYPQGIPAPEPPRISHARFALICLCGFGPIGVLIVIMHYMGLL